MKTTTTAYSLLLATTLLLAGCGVFAPRNFVTYFNTYYNANRLILDAEDEFEFQDEKLKRSPRMLAVERSTLVEETQYLKARPAFLEEYIIKPQQLRPVKTKVDSVLIKGSKILANAPDSDYVSGSLLLMAKAYFYRSEWLSSQIKCQELIQQFPTDEFSPEAHLLLAKNYLMQEKYSAAENTLSKTVDVAWGLENFEVLSEAFRIQAEYALYNNNLEEALKPYRRAIAQSDDAELQASWQFEIGAILYRRGIFDRALTEFQSVLEFSPDLLTKANAQLYIASCLAYLQSWDESENAFEELRDNGNYEDWEDHIIALQINARRLEHNQLEHELDSLERVAEYNSTGIGPEMLKRNLRKDSLRVLNSKDFVHSDTAHIGSGPLSVVAYELGMDAFERGDYTEARKQFAKAKVVRSPVNVTAGRYFRLLNTWEEKSTFVQPILQSMLQGEGTDSLRATVAESLFELGRTHEKLGNRDSAQVYYSYSSSVCPENNEDRAHYLYALSRMFEPGSAQQMAIYQQLFSGYPLTPHGDLARRALGYTEAGVIDSVAESFSSGRRLQATEEYEWALQTFKHLYLTWPDDEYAPRALYHIGWIYEQDLHLNDSALAYYKILIERYPDSEYAEEVSTSVRFALAGNTGEDEDLVPAPSEKDRTTGEPPQQNQNRNMFDPKTANRVNPTNEEESSTFDWRLRKNDSTSTKPPESVNPNDTSQPRPIDKSSQPLTPAPAKSSKPSGRID